MKKILVLGGTGLLGEPVVRALNADGFEVRLLARDPEKAVNLFGDTVEIISGDATDLDSMKRAMNSCDAAHISIGGEIDQLSAENAAVLAQALCIKRITYVSGSTVFDENGWFPMVKQKLMAEQAIRESNVPFTIFCPTWPMEQLPRFYQKGKVMIIGRQPTPIHWFARNDFGRMVANALTQEETIGKRLFIHGPEAITFKEALERYCRVFHPEIKKVSVLPIWAAKIMATVMRSDRFIFFTEIMTYFDKVGEMGDAAETNSILGPAKTTLDTWIEQRKNDQEIKG
jgi:uncharacterized protein YbjT (DUF2867 family)